jgi:NADH:ubiquinone oxidoreductase subunit 5 (subunit L)/multisubunit Na+/H+ antiporter MnhA subunit
MHNIISICYSNIINVQLNVIINIGYLSFVLWYLLYLIIFITKFNAQIFLKIWNVYTNYYAASIGCQFKIDELNIGLLLLVTIIGIGVNIQTSSYLNLNSNLNFFFVVLNIFILSMSFFVMADSFFSIILG